MVGVSRCHSCLATLSETLRQTAWTPPEYGAGAPPVGARDGEGDNDLDTTWTIINTSTSHLPAPSLSLIARPVSPFSLLNALRAPPLSAFCPRRKQLRLLHCHHDAPGKAQEGRYQRAYCSCYCFTCSTWCISYPISSIHLSLSSQPL